MASGTPPAEVRVDKARVRALLRDQHPDLAERSLEVAESGFDNAMFRLGEDLAVRLPRREIAGPLIVHEQKWLPELAARLPHSTAVWLERQAAVLCRDIQARRRDSQPSQVPFWLEWYLTSSTILVRMVLDLTWRMTCSY